jgi:hypothetical protein
MGAGSGGGGGSGIGGSGPGLGKGSGSGFGSGRGGEAGGTEGGSTTGGPGFSINSDPRIHRLSIQGSMLRGEQVFAEVGLSPTRTTPDFVPRPSNKSWSSSDLMVE